MSDCSDPGPGPDELDERLDEWDVGAARVRVGVALSLLELSAVTLETLPGPEVALERHDRTLFQYLRAALTLLDRVVGSEPGATVDRPGGGLPAGADRRDDRVERRALGPPVPLRARRPGERGAQP